MINKYTLVISGYTNKQDVADVIIANNGNYKQVGNIDVLFGHFPTEQDTTNCKTMLEIMGIKAEYQVLYYPAKKI